MTGPRRVVNPGPWLCVLAAALSALALAAAAATTTCAAPDKCEQPISAYDCSRAFIACPQVDERACKGQGGKYIPRGGTCGYCDLCATFVGECEQCNATAGGLMSVCAPPLRCSHRAHGSCVRDELCPAA